MIKKATKYFLAHYNVALAPTVLDLQGFQILEPQRKLKLKKIVWSHRIQDVVSLQLIPLEHNLTQDILLQAGTIAADTIAQDFLNPTNPFVDSARALFQYKPGEYNYNGLYFDQNIQFFIQMTNNDLLNTYNHDFNIYVEVEVIWNVE